MVEGERVSLELLRETTKGLIQELMARAATNIKRLVHLLCAPTEAEPSQT